MTVLAVLASWLTPTALFLLLNLMIGTIFITSRFGSDFKKKSGSDHYPNSAPLARAPSFIDRVKSINLNLPNFPTANDAGPESFGEIGSDDNPAPVARAPSVLERVKSIKFSSFYRSEPSNSNPETHSDETMEPSEPQPYPNPATGSGRIAKSVPRRSKSEGNRTVAKASEKMKKSDSEKSGAGHNREGKQWEEEEEEEETVEAVEMQRQATARFERSTSFEDGEEGVDAKASDFINRFKQQLKLQRLDSIIRYKEMLKANRVT